jgi:hypothetical protein
MSSTCFDLVRRYDYLCRMSWTTHDVCPLVLAHDVDLRDIGVWQDACDPRLCSCS